MPRRTKPYRIAMEELMEFHPVAELFPLLPADELDDLANDIATNGLINPIWTYDGKILDGRNRYHACLKVNVTPKYTAWTGIEPAGFVWSQNIRRRHLDSGQQAYIRQAFMPHFGKRLMNPSGA
jgi:hypothetical protein